MKTKSTTIIAFQKILLSAALMFSVVCPFAAIHTISVANFSFSPSSVSASVGDTIEWVWSSGSHTTTSTSVPEGADTWNAPINSASTSFQYVVMMSGTYNFHCSIHTSMTGTITVTGTTGVQEPVGAAIGIKAFPNPFNRTFELNFTGTGKEESSTVQVTDMLGNEVWQLNTEPVNGNNRVMVDLDDRASGIYFVRITDRAGNTTPVTRIVKR